jgi:hypothetical protein
VKNATRTPRPFHAALPVEWVAGRMIGGPRDLMADNARAGVDLLEGLDLPFPHRLGSSPCCPASTLSVVELGRELRDAYETSDEMPPGLWGRVGRLARHLSGPRHRVEGLPLVMGRDDFAAAFVVVAAGARECETYLSTWQTNAEDSAAIRKVAKKKERARKASAKRRASQSAKEGGRRAVQALQRQSRTGRKLSPLKSAAALLSRGALVEVQRAAVHDRWTHNLGRVERVDGSDALVMIGRDEVFLPVRRLKVIGY